MPATDEPLAKVTPASGDKCARCWRVLTEVGSNATHPTLCLRCADAVELGLVCKPAGVTRTTFQPLGIVAALVVLVADQVSKWWVLNVLRPAGDAARLCCCRC